MTNSILRGLRSLHLFSGRDTRSEFWPYAAVVIIALFMLLSVGMAYVAQDVFADAEQFAIDHPDAVTVQLSATTSSISIDAAHPDAPQPDFSVMFILLGGTVAAAVVLLAAAVSRRLHDCNRPAWLGLTPAIFLTSGLILFPRIMDDILNSSEPNLSLFGLLFLTNILYLATLVALIVQCSLKGSAGPNRYGSEARSSSV